MTAKSPLFYLGVLPKPLLRQGSLTRVGGHWAGPLLEAPLEAQRRGRAGEVCGGAGAGGSALSSALPRTPRWFGNIP